ncbi:hypothetical protein HDU79_005708 [Rhizoclosmatium sp. JEL0117]|nr:hypothetical protein HDU79_005708 [Rhizoclosmatium sp. JEL0117]
MFLPIVLSLVPVVCVSAADPPAPVVDHSERVFAESTTPVHYDYSGGRLLVNAEITPIWYNVTKELQDDLVNYYKVISASSWMDIFTEYNSPTQTIGKGKVLSPVTYKGEILNALDDFIDIREIIRQMVRDGTITPNKNSYYAFHVSPYTNVTLYDSTVCYSNVGAYHGCAYSADVSLLDCVPYGVVPSCLSDDQPNTADSVAHAASHEFAESVTDADPGTGWMATIDGAGGIELADYCGGDNIPQDDAYGFVKDVNGRDWPVSGLWSGADQRCVVGTPKNPVTLHPVVKPTKTVKAKFKTGSPLKAIEINPVFYGRNVNYSAEMADYYNFIASSKYLDILAEYSSTPMGRGKSLPPRYEASSQEKLEVEDDVNAYLSNLIAAGTLKPNKNSFYAIHVSPEITVTMNGDDACDYGCGFSVRSEISTDKWKGTVRYAVIPNQPKCANYCSSWGTNPLANLQSRSSVHIVDAVTDFVKGSNKGWQLNADTGLAWKCYEDFQYHQAPIFDQKKKSYVVNKIWSNKYQECIGSVPIPNPTKRR